MNVHVLIPLLCGLILVGCVNGIESDENLAGADPAADAAPPAQPVPDAPAEKETTLPDAGTFADEVDHVYFPLTPGTQWTYEGDSERMHRRDEIRVLEKDGIL